MRGDTFRRYTSKHLEISRLAIYEFNENRPQKARLAQEGMGERFRTWENAKCVNPGQKLKHSEL